MTSLPSPEKPSYDPATEFHARQARIGVSVVQELVLASDEDRQLAGKQTVEFLDACSEKELAYFAQNLDFLYATTTAIGQGISLRDVDIFGRAFLESLESQQRSIDETTAQKFGQMVLRSRYNCQAPSKKVFPFTYERNRKLLFAAK